MDWHWLQANATQVIDAIFAVTVGALVVLHVLVYAIPLALVRFNALPWAFRLEFNTDLDFQTVTYATVHDSWQAKYSHLTLPLEYLAWGALLWMWHPAALACTTALVVVMLLLGEEKRFGKIASVVGLLLAILTAWSVEAIGAAQLALPAKALLLVGPLLRFVGHTFDPIPPWVGCEADAFKPLSEARMGWRFPFIVVSGWLSESAASLPFRLFWVQLFWLTQRLGIAPQTLRPWSEANQLGRAIRQQGWKAFPKVGDLFAAMVPRS